mmetsp:Transcript_18415/g.59526  ORF Transcript_18415/g.59526 Transcript_18415/m.59526 type:complete len:188 (+) Transcript_18415:383-946(+)
MARGVWMAGLMGWVVLALLAALLLATEGKVMKKKSAVKPAGPKVKVEIHDTPLAPCTRNTRDGDVLMLDVILWYKTEGEEDWVWYDKRERKKNEALYEITLGTGFPIQGWHDGLLGRCLQDTVMLYIPPELGWGMEGRSDPTYIHAVPPNATLKHKIKIDDIINVRGSQAGFTPAPPPQNKKEREEL